MWNKAACWRGLFNLNITSRAVSTVYSPSPKMDVLHAPHTYSFLRQNVSILFLQSQLWINYGTVTNGSPRPWTCHWQRTGGAPQAQQTMQRDSPKPKSASPSMELSGLKAAPLVWMLLQIRPGPKMPCFWLMLKTCGLSHRWRPEGHSGEWQANWNPSRQDLTCHQEVGWVLHRTGIMATGRGPEANLSLRFLKNILNTFDNSDVNPCESSGFGLAILTLPEPK